MSSFNNSDIDLLVLTWHQTYLSSFAGGYIRLREFFQYMPRKLRFLVLDNAPSIYKDILHKKNIRTYQTTKVIKPLMKRIFFLWFVLENISAAFVIYRHAKKLIQKRGVKVVYVPIGEFFHLYIPAILLKKKHPYLKLVVDILNYELPGNSYSNYFRILTKAGTNPIIAIGILLHYAIITTVMNATIRSIDYMFTVSPDLVKKIKRVYQKSTIDYTPSGINLSDVVKKDTKKIFDAVYVGRVTVRKGIFEVLNVWKNVVSQKPNARLAIAGHTSEMVMKQLKKTIEQYGIKKNVTIFGVVSNKKKFEILSQSEIFLHLAPYEPLFPVIGILEGLAAGLPVVIYDMPVVKSQKKELHDIPCIMIVENGNTSQAVDTIADYLASNIKNKQMVTKQARTYAKRFDWKVIARKELDIIEGLINN
ncbi:glycosyltransferase family 4 protein [Candidatus Woesebacteria bacterium]|nr:glycosyltransferase family 4 protein [Candidatus Woesebacteria bacterium]